MAPENNEYSDLDIQREKELTKMRMRFGVGFLLVALVLGLAWISAKSEKRDRRAAIDALRREEAAATERVLREFGR